jgi:hypothetical protein
MFIVPAVVLDTLVACFLTVGLYKNSKLFISKMPLVNLIIRDGVLYFCVVFASNVAWILTAILADNDVRTFDKVYFLASQIYAKHPVSGSF